MSEIKEDLAPQPLPQLLIPTSCHRSSSPCIKNVARAKWMKKLKTGTTTTTLMTRGPPLSPSQASFPPSSVPAQTNLSLIQCFFPDFLQRQDMYDQDFARFWYTHKNMRMQSTFERIGRWASLRTIEALPPDLFAPQPVMKPT